MKTVQARLVTLVARQSGRTLTMRALALRTVQIERNTDRADVSIPRVTIVNRLIPIGGL